MYFKDLTFNSTNLNTSLLLLVFCVFLYACMCVHVFLDACLPVSLLVSARGITWVGSISILLQGFWFHYRSQKGQEMRGNVQGNERENARNVAAKWHNNLTNHLSLFCVCVPIGLPVCFICFCLTWEVEERKPWSQGLIYITETRMRLLFFKPETFTALIYA